MVTVFNPGPGGGLSNSLTFTITTGAVDPQSIAVDPTGKFAYVINGGCSGGIGGYVSMYTINPATQALASIGPPVWTYDADTPGSMTVDPSGRFVYVANPGDPWSPDYGSVSMYSINATTGALTYTGMLSGNCPGLCFPSSVAVDPSGKFAYVASGGADFPFNVEMYTIDATTGALASIGTIAAGGYPQAVAVDPAGKFIYVVTASATAGSPGSVSMYAINATTGALTSTGTIAAGEDPVAVAVESIRPVRLRGECEFRIGWQRVHVRDRRHEWNLKVHRHDRRGKRSALRSLGSCGRVRLCNELQLERCLDVQHQQYYRVLNTHRNDSGGAVSFLDNHTSVRQVRLCDEFRFERRLDVQHWCHRDFDTHRDNRHMKGQIY